MGESQETRVVEPSAPRAVSDALRCTRSGRSEAPKMWRPKQCGLSSGDARAAQPATLRRAVTAGGPSGSGSDTQHPTYSIQRQAFSNQCPAWELSASSIQHPASRIQPAAPSIQNQIQCSASSIHHSPSSIQHPGASAQHSESV